MSSRPSVHNAQAVLYDPLIHGDLGSHVFDALANAEKVFPIGTPVYQSYNVTSKKWTGRIISHYVYIIEWQGRRPYVYVEYDIRALDGRVRAIQYPNRLQSLIDDHERKLDGHRKRLADVLALSADPPESSETPVIP